MREFASYISERWELSLEIADAIAKHHEANDSIHFLTDYIPNLATQTPYTKLSEVYRFLDQQKALNVTREKTRTILKKADLYDDDAEEKIVFSISQVELDDMSLAHRTSVRTRGQAAIGRGLAPLAELLDGEFSGDMDAEMQKYVGKDDALKTIEDVKAGTKDILVELYGYDEHARVLVREFSEDEGSLEIHFKKKTKKYDKWRDKQIQFDELTDEDLLFLREGETKGEIKVKVAVQVFHVNELLKQEFLQFEANTAMDFLLDAMHEAWERLLQPMVDESVKEHLYGAAEANIVHTMVDELRLQVASYVTQGNQNLLVVVENSEESLDLLVLDNNGQLKRATTETIRQFGKAFASNKIKQFFDLFRPKKIVIVGNKFGENAKLIVDQTIEPMSTKPEVMVLPAKTKITPIMKSEYFKKHVANLDDNTAKAYAYGIMASSPLALVGELGCNCFQFHAQQHLVGDDRMSEILTELYSGALLARGIELGKRNDHLLKELSVSEELLVLLRKERKAGNIRCKDDLVNIDAIDERLFNNIAGYLVFPESSEILDKSTVHPAEFHMVDALSHELKKDISELVKNKQLLLNYESEDAEMVQFTRERLAPQVAVAQRYLSLSARTKRRMGLHELRIDNVYDGKVTNITKFGVFIDINAVSDGLVHISELVDQYVESAEQVVSPGERVRVKVIEIDKKKKRISLSMKQAGNSRKVHASQHQLEDLAYYFNS